MTSLFENWQVYCFNMGKCTKEKDDLFDFFSGTDGQSYFALFLILT